MLKTPRIFTYLIVFLTLALGALSHTPAPQSFIKVFIHNIGQGNCVTTHLYDHESGQSAYLVIDAGSSSYHKEIAYQNFLKDRGSKVRHDTLHSSTPGNTLAQPTEKVLARLSRPSLELEKIREIRASLGETTERKAVIIKTLFVSHPDIDHYNWLPKIFDVKKYPHDTIENIILGGLPYAYSASLKAWLLERAPKSRIYFPAILCPQPLERGRLTSLLSAPAENLPYASQLFSHPETGAIQGDYDHLKGFQDAIPYTDTIKTYLLTVNPTHFKEEEIEEVFRACDDTKSNSESLVVKLKVGDLSVDIMGDATLLTTNRILRNYRNHPTFLRHTTATIAFHHGSYTHGSNDKSWIQATLPYYVIFSCGIGHNHPALETFNRFKTFSFLAPTQPHDIWVWQDTQAPFETLPSKEISLKGKPLKRPQAKKRQVQIYTAFYGLFSTFNQGTIQLTLSGSKIYLQGQQMKAETLDFERPRLFPLENGMLLDEEKAPMAMEIPAPSQLSAEGSTP